VNRNWSLASLSYRILGMVGVVFLLLPIVITVWTSFTPSEYLAKPSMEFSTRWYETVISDPRWTTPFFHSVIIAVLAAIISVSVATPAALALSRSHGKRAALLTFAVLVPFFMPGLILAVGLLIFEQKIHLAGTYLGIALAHSLWCTPVAFLAVRAVYINVDHSAEEAARVLGAGPIRTFFLVILPSILPGMAVGALFAFVISFNEFMMSLFLTTPSTYTLPVVIWTSLRYEVSPAVAAISAIFIILSTVIASIALVIVGQRGVVSITGGSRREGV
jgi:ABC-type spermidine/putrescine transport system permease subunit II